MKSRAFALLGATAFAMSIAGCSAHPSPGPCSTAAANSCEIDAKKICEANKDLESPINGFADTQSQREQNLRPTWTWVHTLNIPGGTQIGIACEMNVQHHRVVYASVARGQELSSHDAEYLQNQGFCLNSPSESAELAAACAQGGPAAEVGAARPPRGGLVERQLPGMTSLATRPNDSSMLGATQAEEPEWLERLNAYRRAAGLKAVAEDRAESDGDLKHARYLVKNLRPGVNPGVEAHLEKEGNPWFTREGANAGRTSDVIPPSNGLFDDDTAIDGWLGAPFHALPMLDPDLTEAGFGRYCENGVCAAVLNVGRGGKWMHSQKLVMQKVVAENGEENYLLTREARTLNRPIEFPPRGSVIGGGVFNGMEWPNPLLACPGYKPPTGTVILISFGSAFVPAVTRASISTGGAPLESCLVTSENYKSPEKAEMESGKGNLKLYAAALLIPRQPLEAGKTYDVSVTKDSMEYNWSFKIEPKGLIVSE